MAYYALGSMITLVSIWYTTGPLAEKRDREFASQRYQETAQLYQETLGRPLSFTEEEFVTGFVALRSNDDPSEWWLFIFAFSLLVPLFVYATWKSFTLVDTPSRIEQHEREHEEAMKRFRSQSRWRVYSKMIIVSVLLLIFLVFLHSQT